MRYRNLLCYLILLTLEYNEAARILCYQWSPCNSHHKIMDVLTEELSQQGHELVVVTPLPRQEQKDNITEIDIHDMTYSRWKKEWKEARKNRTTFGFPDSIEFLDIASKIMRSVVVPQLGHPQIQALIDDENQRFDLIIVEQSANIGNIFNTRFHVPLLVVSPTIAATRTFSGIGATTDDFFFPDDNPIITQKWNFPIWKRLYCYYKRANNIFKMLADLLINSNSQVSRNMKLNNNLDMLFLNVHRFWDNNRPAPIGSVLYMGGLHLKTPKSLPQNLKTIVDNSKHGVVLMSLGTLLKSSELPARTLQVIINVFSQLPYDFIWIWDTDEIPNKPNNVRFEKSVPQSDLLHHPKIRAFITQGGLLSTDEAIDARVPLIGLPVFGDQWQNTQQHEKHGIGIWLDIDLLQEDDFRNAIVAVVEDKKYRENINRLARIVSDRRESSLRTASRWVRSLVTHGARHLRSPLADTTFVEFYMLDLVLIAAICVLVAIIAIELAVKRLFKLLAIRINWVISKDLKINSRTEARQQRTEAISNAPAACTYEPHAHIN